MTDNENAKGNDTVKLALAWLAVGLPLAWGVVETLQKGDGAVRRGVKRAMPAKPRTLPIWSQAGARSVERAVERRGTRPLGGRPADRDLVVAEEPLEIRIAGESLMVTMRTPGDDLDLAAGLLFTEGVISSLDEVASLDARRLRRRTRSRQRRRRDGGARARAQGLRRPPRAARDRRLRPVRQGEHRRGPPAHPGARRSDDGAARRRAGAPRRDPGRAAGLLGHRRPARRRSLHARGGAAPGPRGRRPPQRGRQGHRRPAARRLPARWRAR